MNTFRKIGIAGGVTALLLSATFVNAETAGYTYATENQVNVVTNGSVGARMEAKAGERMERDPRNLRTASTTGRAEAMTHTEENKAKMAERMEKARVRISEIKDKTKQQEAERLTAQFDRINKARTEHFAKLLERYSDLLKKIEEHKIIAGDKTENVAAMRTAIASAKTAIETAKAAVAIQAAKTYVLNTAAVTTTHATTTPAGQEKLMKGLRTAFHTLHSQLKGDLTTLRDGAMKDARKAVQGALQTIGKTSKDDRGTATTTATTTTTVRTSTSTN